MLCDLILPHPIISLSYTILYYTILYHTILNYTVLYYTILSFLYPILSYCILSYLLVMLIIIEFLCTSLLLNVTIYYIYSYVLSVILTPYHDNHHQYSIFERFIINLFISHELYRLQLAVRDKLIQRQQALLVEHGLDDKVILTVYYAT